MIVLKSYKQMPRHLEVILGCTCERPRITEETVGAEKLYRCRTCESVTTLKSLRDDSSTQWRHQHWVVRQEKRADKRHEIDLTVRIQPLTAGERLDVPPLLGKARNISLTGLSVAASNLTHEFLSFYKSNVLEADVRLPSRLHEFLPETLRARIVYVDCKEENLPHGTIGLSFVNLSQTDLERLKQYVGLLQK